MKHRRPDKLTWSATGAPCPTPKDGQILLMWDCESAETCVAQAEGDDDGWYWLVEDGDGIAGGEAFTSWCWTVIVAETPGELAPWMVDGR